MIYMAKSEKPKSKRKVTPTLRQQRLSVIISSGKKKSVKAAMIEAGYSESTAKRSTKVMDSKGWEKLMDKFLPDKLIAKTEREQLRATTLQRFVFPPSMEDDVVKDIVKNTPGAKLLKITRGEKATHVSFLFPDNTARGKSLDRAYKLKLKYPKEKSEDSLNTSLEAALARIDGILPTAGE